MADWILFTSRSRHLSGSMLPALMYCSMRKASTTADLGPWRAGACRDIARHKYFWVPVLLEWLLVRYIAREPLVHLSSTNLFQSMTADSKQASQAPDGHSMFQKPPLSWRLAIRSMLTRHQHQLGSSLKGIRSGVVQNLYHRPQEQTNLELKSKVSRFEHVQRCEGVLLCFRHVPKSGHVLDHFVAHAPKLGET